MIRLLARRELLSLFCSPIAWVVLAIFSIGTSVWFVKGFHAGEEASLRPTLEFAVLWILPFLAPAVSMRMLSEEFRTGTFEKLMTSPLSDTQVILGKWLGAVGFYAALLVPLLAQLIALECVGSPDYGPAATGILGLGLVGGLYMAVGLFASTFTQNQVVAFLVTVFILSIPSVGLSFVKDSPFLAARWQSVAAYISVEVQYRDFAKGVVDIRNFVYFLSGIALFLFLAVKSLESRRWR
jgi:ABC-2 type transport system permease protein